MLLARARKVFVFVPEFESRIWSEEELLRASDGFVSVFGYERYVRGGNGRLECGMEAEPATEPELEPELDPELEEPPHKEWAPHVRLGAAQVYCPARRKTSAVAWKRILNRCLNNVWYDSNGKSVDGDVLMSTIDEMCGWLMM